MQDGFAFVGGQVHRYGKIVAVNEVMADRKDGMARFESAYHKKGPADTELSIDGTFVFRKGTVAFYS